MKYIVILLLATISVFNVTYSIAAISFDANGKWETTFDCAEQLATDYAAEDQTGCDGIQWSTPQTVTPDGNASQVTTSANNPDGGGVRGFRLYQSDGDNASSGGMKIYFPSAQPELWIRWTLRYELGYSFTLGRPQYDKHLYIRTGGDAAGTQAIPEFQGYTYALVAQSTSSNYQVQSDEGTGGWTDVMNGGSTGDGTTTGSETGDGEWHTYEVHIKMDTDQTDGIGRVWVDGDLVAENIAVDWSDGRAAALPGWERFNFISNYAYVTGGPYYIDVDDMVVYNQTPPNTDLDGNAYIGPLDLDTTNPTVTATDLPNQASGTTSVTPSTTATDDTDVTACKWAVTDIAYGSMTGTMTEGASNLWTADSDLTGLSDGDATTIYYGCTDAAGLFGYSNDAFSVNTAGQIRAVGRAGETTLRSGETVLQ